MNPHECYYCAARFDRAAQAAGIHPTACTTCARAFKIRRVPPTPSRAPWFAADAAEYGSPLPPATLEGI